MVRQVRVVVSIVCALRALGAVCPVHAAEPPIVPPRPTTQVEATYPADAGGKSADVTLAIEVLEDGAVGQVDVVKPTGTTFDAAAIAAAKQWHFQPATKAGVPVATRVRLSFHFEPPPPINPQPQPQPQPEPPHPDEPIEVRVSGRKPPPSRGISDYHLDVGALALVPRTTAADYLKLAPGILLTNEGGEGHAEQVFLRGFDAREGQDIEFSVDGVPINESGNLHGNGYSDTHFIIPELIESLRVLEGPFDPRQGNYAVAGSADYRLGISDPAARGLTAKFTVGSFGTYRMLGMWAPPGGSPGTFAAVELYQTNGYGQNRDGQRASAMAQYEGHHGAVDLRVTAQAYIASFHTAGVLRDDDFRSRRLVNGRALGFYDTYDPHQGEDSSRYSLAGELDTHAGQVAIHNQAFAIARPLRLRENFTGFLLDTQEPQQQPHGQRGDLLDLNVMEWTVGARGSARLSGVLFKQLQELELGYFARGDFVTGSQQRISASGAGNPPYKTETNLDSRLGDIGLYADANLRFLRWLAVRGGIRGDVFTYDVNNLCAQQSAPATTTIPPGDASCLDQIAFGQHREPNQRASTVSAAYLPRGSLLVGPWQGVSFSASAGQGARSLDPQDITQDRRTPFASITAYEGGVMFSRRFRDSMDLALRSVAFFTAVDRELVFDQSLGRNASCGGSQRIGSASSLRFTGPFWDLAANVTYVQATFTNSGVCSDSTLKQLKGDLIPYVPDLVVRADGALFGELPWWRAKLRGHPIRASLGAGFTYVGPRPLPFGERSDTIATFDARATVGWWFADFSLSALNLFNTQYRLGEYNYASDFHSQPFPTLVPARHFAAGAPLTLLFSVALNYGGLKR